MKVFFIGAGPGDPELLTIKAYKIISIADIIIYAGSLVSKSVLEYAKQGAQIHDSAHMTFEEVTGVMAKAKATKMIIARLHTGDPSLYSSIGEQIQWCRKQKIRFEVIPGVSSFSAAAARLSRELTLPGVSQSVVITRAPGRTPVPEKEALSSFAKTGASLVLFLSAGNIDAAVRELKQGYPPDTPAAAVYKASWPDMKIVRGTVSTIAGKMKESGITRHVLILVGDVLGKRNFKKSRLYHKTFSHGYRKAK